MGKRKSTRPRSRRETTDKALGRNIGAPSTPGRDEDVAAPGNDKPEQEGSATRFMIAWLGLPMVLVVVLIILHNYVLKVR